MRIGQRIRRLRREAKKTLLEVATEAKLSVGFLSQVERHLTGISISSLVNVAKALNVPLGALIDQPRQAQPDSHQGRRESYAVDRTSQWYERLSTTFDGSQINAVKVQMMEGYRSEWVAHGGDEFVYVLDGRICYTVGKKDYPLSAGDSLHFDARKRHRVANVGDGPAELIVVGTLPLFDDGQAEFVSATMEIRQPGREARAIPGEPRVSRRQPEPKRGGRAADAAKPAGASARTAAAAPAGKRPAAAATSRKPAARTKQ
ncbi:HTH-type transcriptional regulator SutR [Burkholderia pseudomultivorans]|uniref:HTH-type transcriptional regulator SutR n=3 Tax=Burkholderia pseudomultivorans TaxID=1207504 RepID=A0ABU2E679_9BURK|nr:HTH-type transcriptional regulator SutR [Burkholderia pseudomultivorans]MDR8735411.1 HTH-type transcriptional regulator SutR [Burkholderia pseudomultivorans]MDR8741213.1 HTH-type transcriptional regulator SutR [Burkholderia pseudomultivorans]MDR8755377.1 HTH-type transcriptional regulator SutR [Burkholderia pseudomultivorans]MDR8777627.1 HTH-type transcriptional regulator SutR [Burkholderia pseudomultivorans]